MYTDIDDAADARHDTPYVPPERCVIRVHTPYVPPERCVIRVHTPSQMCTAMSTTTYTHSCGSMKSHVGRTTCSCPCGFRWDTYMYIVSTNG